MRAKRRKSALTYGGGLAVIVVIVVIITALIGHSSPGTSTASGAKVKTVPIPASLQMVAAPATTQGDEGIPIPIGSKLATLANAATGQTVNGVKCQAGEQLVSHVHTHLTIFVNGQQRQVPAAIGIPGAVAQQTNAGPFIGSGTCFYWLHTHAADGIIHIESPVERTYTLGDFFDEWGQPLGPDQVGPATGKVTAIVNGKVFKGNPRNVPLGSHENLQLDVGTPLIAPETIDWSNTGL